jgi:hypothetical protein
MSTAAGEPPSWRRPFGLAAYGLAAVILLATTFVAAFRVHGFYIGCGEDESPFGNSPPTCFDPLGYNNHAPFRILLILGGLLIAAALVMAGWRLARRDRPHASE